MDYVLSIFMYLVSYQSKVFHHFGEQVCFSNWSLLPELGVPLCAITKGNTLHLPIDLPLHFVAEWRSNYGRTCTDLNKVVKLGLNYVHVSTSIGHTGNNGWCLIPDISHGYLFVCLGKKLPYQTCSCFWWQLSGLLNINIVFWTDKGQQSFVDESRLLHSKRLGCHVKNCNRSIFCIQISKNKLFPKSLLFLIRVVCTWKSWKASLHANIWAHHYYVACLFFWLIYSEVCHESPCTYV